MPAKIEKNDIEQGLVRKRLEFNAKQNQVLREAAQALVPELARTTPVSYRKKHAKSHVTISNVRTDKNSYEKYIVVGYEKGYSHRIHATEFGTMYQRPQLWITKTEKNNRQLVYRKMLSAMKKVIK